jgi:hypothetical protein
MVEGVYFEPSVTTYETRYRKQEVHDIKQNCCLFRGLQAELML